MWRQKAKVLAPIDSNYFMPRGRCSRIVGWQVAKRAAKLCSVVLGAISYCGNAPAAEAAVAREGPEPGSSAPKSEEERCSLWLTMVGHDYSECSTPRYGTLSGFYIGFDGGIVSMKADAEEREGLALGGSAQVRLGAAFWDQWVVGLGFGGYFPKDEKPFSELVVDCLSVDGTVVSCDDQARRQESGVTGTFFAFETGYQYRFRPWRTTSWSPGAFVGYLAPLGTLERRVDCQGCDGVPLDVTMAGAYVGPFFRVTFGNVGEWAAILRSQWFVSGDLQQISQVGIEWGIP